MKNSKLSVIILLLAFLLAACSSSAAASPAGATATPAASAVVSEGHLVPRKSADLAFMVTGRVAEVLVKTGDQVTAGQPLARLEVQNIEMKQADLARAEQEALSTQQALDDLNSNAAVNLAQANKNVVDDQKALDDARQALADARKEGENLVVSQAEAQAALLESKLANDQAYLEKLGSSGLDPVKLDAARARQAAAQAALASAQAALKPVELQAPWAGTISDISLVAGQSVTPGLPAASLADFSSWIIETDDLTELKVTSVTVGQKVSLAFDALPEQSLVGTVESIAPKFVEQRGDITYTVTISVDEPSPEARWGMTAAIRFEK